MSSDSPDWRTAIQRGAYRVAKSERDLPTDARRVGGMGGYTVYEASDGHVLKRHPGGNEGRHD